MDKTNVPAGSKGKELYASALANLIEKRLQKNCVGYQFVISYKENVADIRSWGHARISHDAPARTMSILDLYNTAAAPLAQREVGRITQEMPRAATESGESMLGDVIADAQLAATSTTQLGGSQIAFMNDGGIRTDLRGSQGLVSYSDAFSIHPFGNGLITLSLTGAQIDKLLEQQWTHSGSQLQVSRGFSYEWSAGAPLGQRVDMASIRLHGVPLDPAKTYRVTVNEFLAQGGDGYSVLIEGTERIRGVTDVQALTKYLAENSPLAPPAIERVRKLH